LSVCPPAPVDLSNYKSDRVEPYTVGFVMISNGGGNGDSDF